MSNNKVDKDSEFLRRAVGGLAISTAFIVAGSGSADDGDPLGAGRALLLAVLVGPVVVTLVAEAMERSPS